MIFFISTMHQVVQKGIPFFERAYLELISVSVFCENGNSYYAINKSFSSTQVSRDTQEKVVDHLTPRDRVLWHKPAQIATAIEQFINYNAGEAPVELYGYKCYDDFSLFRLLFPKYPDNFPEFCQDIYQDILRTVETMAPSDFSANVNFSMFPPLEEATMDEKIECFMSHKNIPVTPLRNTAYLQSTYIGKLFAALQKYPEEVANISLEEVPDTNKSVE